MTELYTSAIPVSGIKMKWNESYVSDAINTQAAVNSPGVYRGGIVSEEGTPSQRFIITYGSDPDTFVLHLDPTTQYATTVKISGETVVDMSSGFSSGGAIPSDVNWYVGVTSSYVNGTDTTASIIVSDIPIDGMVQFAVIRMTAGATVINQADIDISGTSRTRPARKGGIIYPVISRASVSSSTYVSLSGKVFLGDMASGNAEFMVRICNAQGKPFIAADGHAVEVDWFYTDSSLTTAVTAADLDYNKCFENPKVKLSFGDGSETTITGTAYCRYLKFMELDEIPDGTGFSVDFIKEFPHDRNVYANPLPAISSPAAQGYIAGGLLHDTLKAMMNQVHYKLARSIASTSVWIPIWTSHESVYNASSNAIWYKNGSIATVSNCSLSSTGVVTPHSSSSPVRISIAGVSSYEMYVANPGALSLSVSSQANWDTYMSVSAGNTNLFSLDDSYPYYRLLRDVKDIFGSTMLRNTEHRTNGFGANQYPIGKRGTMGIDVLAPGITYESDIKVDGDNELGIKRGRPIVIDISALTFTVGIADIYAYVACDLEISNFEWTNTYCPAFRASIRQISSGSNFAEIRPATVRIDESSGGGTYAIKNIRILGDTTTNGQMDSRHLILDIEAYYHDNGQY